MDKELERLEKLKQDAIDNPGKKKRGCSNCKKKKEIIEKLPPLEILYIPSPNDIKLAYEELGSKVLSEEKKNQITNVYKFIFNEEFDFNCRACVNTQARKLKNYITDVLKLKL